MDSYLQFRRPARQCLLCGVQLDTLDRHPSALKFGGDVENAVREDICPTCWDNLGDRDYFGAWVTRRIQEGQTPEQRRLAKSERNEALWALFNAVYAIRSEELEPQVFLLAHLLMKYRVLQFAGVGGDGMLEFVHGPTQERYRVVDLPLDAVSFVDVKAHIDSQLHQYAPARDNGGDGSGDGGDV